MGFYLWIVPIISALIGWLINHLLIRLFFHPLVPKTISGFRFQGLIPKYRMDIAEKIGLYVSEKIFSFNELEQKIINPANITKVLPFIEAHIDEFLKVKLGKEMPFLSMFIGTKTISSLKKTFMEELMILFPLVMKNYADNLRNEFDIKKIIKEKIENIDLHKLEFQFYKSGSKQIRNFKILGAATGFLIGVLQVILYIIFA